MDYDRARAIFFDFGGTLDADGKNWGVRFHDIFKDQGIKLSINDVFDAGKKTFKLLYSDDNSKKLSYRETIDVFIYWTLKYLDLFVEDYKKSIVDVFFNNTINTINKNKIILKALKKKYRLAIISNNFGNCISWCKELGIDDFFDLIIDSTETGLEKPDKKIFLKAVNYFNLNPDQTVYVGDKYEIDIVVPYEIGMMPIWINAEDDKKSKIKDIIRISNLEELKEIFNIREDIKLLI